MPICRRREKVFGPGRAVPLDRNAKARIAAYARAWSARNRQPRQHRGPISRAFLDVLQALLWGFHNSRCCFPGYETIAAKAECARCTVAEALKVLEWALYWHQRGARTAHWRLHCGDLEQVSKEDCSCTGEAGRFSSPDPSSERLCCGQLPTLAR